MSTFDPLLRPVLGEYLLALADDELILGQRAAEWCGHAPIIEEDIAFANLALDEIGHANLFYEVLAGLDDQDPETYPDRLVYFRQPEQYRCCQLVELPNGDWAFSMLRQYLFDAAEKVRLPRLAHSTYIPLAEVAQRILREELYHHRHTQAWVQRLALGTDESRQRMQRALEAAWPYTGGLFAGVPGQESLEAAGITPPLADLAAQWEAELRSFSEQCELDIPSAAELPAPRSEHTPHLSVILAEMQALTRQEPEARW